MEVNPVSSTGTWVEIYIEGLEVTVWNDGDISIQNVTGNDLLDETQWAELLAEIEKQRVALGYES